jgi:RNA polymerase sigma-70 factor (ECF subfamily)
MFSSPDREKELHLLQAIEQGNEDAFMLLIDRYHSSLVGFAQTIVSEEARAQEVAKDAWEAVLKGIHHFDQRTSLKTWIFKNLIDRLPSQGVQPKSQVPITEQKRNPLEEAPSNSHDRASNPSLNLRSLGIRTPSGEPQNQSLHKEGLSGKIFEDLRMALYRLPTQQKQVVYLRDVEGFDSKEVHHLLQISEPHQRLFLQKAREKMRKVLDVALEIPASFSSQKCCQSYEQLPSRRHATSQLWQGDDNTSGKT